jgi:hypothetical protein
MHLKFNTKEGKAKYRPNYHHRFAIHSKKNRKNYSIPHLKIHIIDYLFDSFFLFQNPCCEFIIFEFWRRRIKFFKACHHFDCMSFWLYFSGKNHSVKSSTKKSFFFSFNSPLFLFYFLYKSLLVLQWTSDRMFGI